MNQHKGILEGKWLKTALLAQGVSVHQVARALGYLHHKFYRHINGQSYLNAESLAELLRLYPTMNARYILTGEGEPINPTPKS